MGSTVLVSNHDLPITRELYTHADEIHEVEAFRSVSRGKRGKVKELLAVYRGG